MANMGNMDNMVGLIPFTMQCFHRRLFFIFFAQNEGEVAWTADQGVSGMKLDTFRCDCSYHRSLQWFINHAREFHDNSLIFWLQPYHQLLCRIKCHSVTIAFINDCKCSQTDIRNLSQKCIMTFFLLISKVVRVIRKNTTLAGGAAIVPSHALRNV